MKTGSEKPKDADSKEFDSSACYAVVEPHMTQNGGCSSYERKFEGTLDECRKQKPKDGLLIVDEADEVVLSAHYSIWRA